MIYKITKVIKSDMHDEEFIKLCKHSFRKTVAVCTFFIALCILLWFLIISNFDSIEDAPPILALFAYFSIIPGLISLMLLGGNMHDDGIIFEYLDCKTIKDWSIFAERQVGNPEGTILTKRLESENKEVVEVCLDSKELRCVNTTTGDTEIFFLEEIFREKFELKKKPELANGEMILDFSGAKLIAYIK